MIALLTLPLLAAAFPQAQVVGVHPVTPLLVAAYLFGIRLVRRSHASPMWMPRKTSQTVRDVASEAAGSTSMSLLWLGFGALTLVTAGAGWVLMSATQDLVDATGMSESVAGGLLTATATSLPELMTTIAAVRRGALTLAVSNIFGTNCFNTMIIGAADFAYRDGPIYQDIGDRDLMWGLIAILMSAVLLLGMLRRETYGIGNIGFESIAILLIYSAAATVALVP